MPLTCFPRLSALSCLRPAMEEASAPARTPPAREATSGAPVSWRYEQQRHGTPAAFALHPDFLRFREHITALTQALSDVVKDSPSSVANLKIFLDHVTTVDARGHNGFFGQQAAEVYDKGAEDLERLVRLIRDPRVDRDQARAEIRDLSSPLALCRVAVTEELPSSLQRLSPPPRTLPAKWREAQLNLVEQSAIETLRLSDLKTTNRHAVNALLPVLYKDAGLPDRLPDDPYVRKDLPKSLVKEARRRLRDDLHPASVALLVADDYLMRLSASMPARDAEASPAPVLTLAQMEKAIEALSTEFGSKPPTSAAFRVDLDDGHCAVATDATLLAVHFLDCWRRESASRRQDKPARTQPLDGPAGATKLLTTGRLAWAETRGERRLLELADLPALKPDDLPGSALVSVIRSSAPDDLWTTLPAEWMRDTAAFDALLDRVDDTSLRACFERWQSSPTPLSQGRQVLLRDAVLKRGRGAALFEGATLAWQRLTLPDLEDLQGLRALYRRHLAGELTTDTLQGRLEASWKAAMSDGLLDLMRVSKPGSSGQDLVRPSGQVAIQWLFAAAEALAHDPPQATIDDVSEALRSGTSAQLPAADQAWTIGVQAPYEAIVYLGKAQVELASPERTQMLRTEHARRLLRDVLNLEDGGRSRLLQRAWTAGNVSEISFFIYLEAAVQAMVRRECTWSELTAMLSLEGDPASAALGRRLAYARAFVMARSFPDGPVSSDLLPVGFSKIPTERKQFHDVGIQHDSVAQIAVPGAVMGDDAPDDLGPTFLPG